MFFAIFIFLTYIPYTSAPYFLTGFAIAELFFEMAIVWRLGD